MIIRLPGLFFIAFIIGLSAIGLSACKKNNDAPSTVNSIDSLNIINASVDTINFYLNGTRLNNNSNLYPAGSSGYYTVPSGLQSYQIKKAFNPATSIVQTLFSIPLTFEAHHYYSLFVAGETLALAFSTVDTLKANTIKNTCKVRFVNASPDAGSLDMAVGDTTQFKNQAFKSASGFVLVGVSGRKPIKVYATGSTVPIISGIVNLLAGKSYTFYSKGKLNGTGNAVFSVGATINFN
jgi:hypothetical protein